MSWVALLRLLLTLAGFVAKRTELLATQKAIANELAVLQGKRIDAATAARDDVLSGRVPDEPNDQYRRD